MKYKLQHRGYTPPPNGIRNFGPLIQRAVQAATAPAAPPPVNQAQPLAAQPVQRVAVQPTLSVESGASPFTGCCNFFDRCGDGDMMSLHYAGTLPLLDWMNFTVGTECVRTFEFMTYLRPEQTQQGADTPGHLADPCATPYGVEWGYNKLTIENFGRYGRRGPTRSIMQPQRYCITDQRRRLDGSPVTDEQEWDLRFATDVMIQDISRDVIVGNSSTDGKFDGLERWVRTGYDNPALNSFIVDWNGNTMAGGAGITVNGQAIGATIDFVQVLRSVARRIKTRIGWSPMLRTNVLNPGDMILLMPSHVATCLLDFFTCWSVCPGVTDITVMYQKQEAITFRNSLNGGLFNAGVITLDGVPFHIMAYDWGLIKSASLSDVYLLTGSVGSVQLWFGEHLSAATAAAKYTTAGYFSSDGGRILATKVLENECSQLRAWLHPRIYTRAPWLQARFQNVRCTDILDPLSPDPASSFFVTTSFDAANCAVSVVEAV